MSAVKDSAGPVFAGIDIGGTSIKWMIVDESGTILTQGNEPTNREAVAEQGGRQPQADDGQREDRGARDPLGRLGALNVLGLEEDETDRQQAQRRQEGGFPAEQAAADRQGQDGRGKREDDWREESHGR